jgi:sugar phosphate isomerase/epimerase
MNDYKRKKYPFSLGTTSYILHDDILPNVKYLAPLVDDIEIVLFESPEFSNIPSRALIEQLRDYALDNECGYTIHLPIDRKIGSENSIERKLFFETVVSIIEPTTNLAPRSWVLHCEGISSDASTEQIVTWQQHSLDTLKQLSDVGIDLSKIAVENLLYPAEWNFEIVKKGNCKYCLDVGHLWLRDDNNWEEICLEMLPETNVVHLHGVNDRKDHVSLCKGNVNKISQFVKILESMHYRGVVTLEVFNQADLFESLILFETLWMQM